MAPDVAAAQRFYGSVLGWTFADTDADYGGYTIAMVDGGAAAGIGPMQAGAPPAWTLYFASEDADATAAAISANGGTVLSPPDDVGPLGRMCIAMDPTGAVFGVWQAGEHIGAEAVNRPGGLTWEDLRSTAPAAAQAFYTAVFGHRWQPMEMAGPDYGTFHDGAEEPPLGGAGGMMGAPEGTPSHWLVYFGVADADASVDAVRSGGGTVLAEPFDTPYGRMAAIADPSGAVFWVVEATPGQEMPDRSG